MCNEYEVHFNSHLRQFCGDGGGRGAAITTASTGDATADSDDDGDDGSLIQLNCNSSSYANNF